MKSLFLFLGLCLSLSTEAADLQPVFEALKQSGVNYEPDGAVCEQVARLKLAETYPTADFLVTGGVEYATGGETLGELDIVIFDKATQKVVLVAEVKCWKNLMSAMDKLKMQRDRFTWNLTQFPHRIQFVSYEGLHIDATQFPKDLQFKSISQMGGVRRGFDQELEFSLGELKELRTRLLKCQAWGDCARPQ